MLDLGEFELSNKIDILLYILIITMRVYNNEQSLTCQTCVV